MKALASAYSHLNLAAGSWTRPMPLEQILKSQPRKVKTYDDLVTEVAKIQYHNRQFNLFFRGQTKDYLDKEGKTTILASIFRKKTGEAKLSLKERFVALEKNVEKLRQAFTVSEAKFAGTHLLNKFQEVGWALLQHYQVCPTPVIDITHSLHVACSFACEGNKGQTGVVYVLGLPWPSDAISYNIYEELVNIRLLNICPPQARRPFFQEGYLLGNFPNYKLDSPKRVPQFDPARRIVAKFEIPMDDDFWGKDFKRLPSIKLYPDQDRIKGICESINR